MARTLGDILPKQIVIPDLPVRNYLTFLSFRGQEQEKPDLYRKKRLSKMAATVIQAFEEFLRDSVNLDPNKTNRARSSRDWLVDRIHDFPSADAGFPTLYSVRDIFFGSFARRTKIRPIDDIDIMIALSAQGSSYDESANRITLSVPESVVGLNDLCHDESNLLNSRKVINLFLSKLSDISSYENAEISRNQEAATLKLSSYEWNFDVVPCFFTKPDEWNRTYYLIPDGNGHWKKTDPRIDRDRIELLNTKCDGKLLDVIRIVKYWNKRPTMPSIPSYVLETMVHNFFHSCLPAKAGQFVDLEFIKFLRYLENEIFNPVNDPKGIQGDLNDLEIMDKVKISVRAKLDLEKCEAARNFEIEKKYEESIKEWTKVFGPNFPSYG